MGAQCSSRRRRNEVESPVVQQSTEALAAEQIAVKEPGNGDSLMASSLREDTPIEEDTEVAPVGSNSMAVSVVRTAEDEPAPTAAAPSPAGAPPPGDAPASAVSSDATDPPAAPEATAAPAAEETPSKPVSDKFGRMVDDQGAPFLGDGCRFLHGPVDYRFCFVMLEQHPALNLPRLRVDGRKHSFTDQTLADALVTMEGIVDRREPLTVTYDLRSVCVPSMRQVKMGIAWCGEHKEALDECIQGITVILSSWVLTKMCNFVFSVLKPPQPTKICKDDAEAVSFLDAKCQTAQSWAGAGARKGSQRKPTRSAEAAPASSAMAEGDEGGASQGDPSSAEGKAAGSSERVVAGAA